MKLVKLSELFDVKYGVNLELNKLEHDSNGVNFVSRSMKNNGVAAKVKKLANVEPLEAGLLTVAGGGSVLATFVQPEPFYSGRDLYYLRPKVEMTLEQKLYYSLCISSNRYRYNYGRQANRTLRDILIPAIEETPGYVSNNKSIDYSRLNQPFHNSVIPSLETKSWKEFKYSAIFDIKKGKRLTKQNMTAGVTPFVGSSDANNGVTSYVGQAPEHKGNTITVAYDGSVGEAFYQQEAFWALDSVNVLYPKFALNKYSALFLTTLIRKEKYRFNYGRKWHLGRMKESVIKLPVDGSGQPDWLFMESYIKSLPFSSGI